MKNCLRTDSKFSLQPSLFPPVDRYVDGRCQRDEASMKNDRRNGEAYLNIIRNGFLTEMMSEMK